MIGLLAAALLVSDPAPASHCALANAIPASVREMGRHPEQWLGRCVRLEGYVQWNNYYADVAGAYAAMATNRADRANDGWLGLYFHGRGRLDSNLVRGTVYGILRDCGRDFQAAEARSDSNDLIMPVGYCHYRSGLILLPARFRAAGLARFERQIGEAARNRFGDLAASGTDRPVPPEVVRLADRFLALVRARDGPGLRALVGLWSEQEPPTDSASAAFTAWLREDGESPIGSLRSVAAPQRAYFQEALSRDSAINGEVADWHICFCRAADCTGRWPISAFDATSGPRLPYICLVSYRHDLGPGEPDRLGIDRLSRSFAEPGEFVVGNASTR